MHSIADLGLVSKSHFLNILMWFLSSPRKNHTESLRNHPKSHFQIQNVTILKYKDLSNGCPRREVLSIVFGQSSECQECFVSFPRSAPFSRSPIPKCDLFKRLLQSETTTYETAQAHFFGGCVFAECRQSRLVAAIVAAAQLKQIYGVPLKS